MLREIRHTTGVRLVALDLADVPDLGRLLEVDPYLKPYAPDFQRRYRPAALAPAPGERHVDATFGAGGYTRAILATGAEVVAFDRDPDAVATGAALAAAEPRLTMVAADFSAMAAELEARGMALLDAAADLVARQCAAQLIQSRLLPKAGPA